MNICIRVIIVKKRTNYLACDFDLTFNLSTVNPKTMSFVHFVGYLKLYSGQTNRQDKQTDHAEHSTHADRQSWSG